ncbi:MAG: endonuclease [Gemmatimonadetes bacterium]|jgi:endonuclease-3|nr:endonuclease [Gemmatimonadota bacterium]
MAARKRAPAGAPALMVKAAKRAAKAHAEHPPAKRPARRRRLRGAALQAQADTVLQRLLAEYPDAHCALDHRNAFELLSATILSAQCTDKRVNMVTPALFARYPDASTMASARQEDVEELVRSAGFFRSKAKSLIGMASAIVARHDGAVPDAMEDLVVLPGVGRKTANVVLGNAFGRNEGIVVDTHVTRLANRLGLTTESDAVKIERALIPLFPREHWTILSHLLIEHGRQVCDARKPRCSSCLLADICPSALV